MLLQPLKCTTYRTGLGSSPVARHYWGNHCYFLFLQVLRCFSSLRSPVRQKKRTCTGFTRAGCPIRKSAHQRLCAPTRGLSQLITSFIASVSLGIRHVPLHTFVAHTFSCRESGNCLLFSKFSYSLLCLSQYVKELSSECRKNTGKGEQRHRSGE